MENKEQENKSHLYISYWGEKIRQSRLGIGNSNFDLMNFMKSEVEKMLRFPRLPIFYIFGRLLDNNIQNNARKVQAIIKEHQISPPRVISARDILYCLQYNIDPFSIMGCHH